MATKFKGFVNSKTLTEALSSSVSDEKLYFPTDSDAIVEHGRMHGGGRLLTHSWSGFIRKDNTASGSDFVLFRVDPIDTTKCWTVKFELNGYYSSSYQQQHIIEITGFGTSAPVVHATTFNNSSSISDSSVFNMIISYVTTSNSYIGISTANVVQPTSSRTITLTLMDYGNCNVTLNDAPANTDNATYASGHTRYNWYIYSIGTTSSTGFTYGGLGRSNSYLLTSGGYVKNSITLGNKSVAVGGTLTEIPEAYLSWGGRNLTQSFSPLDASLSSYLSANRLAFGKPAGITIEYSRDAGVTWTDYGATDNEKQMLFTKSISSAFYIGKSTASQIADANCQLRVTLKFPAFGLYALLKKFIITCGTAGSTGCWCTIDAAVKSNPTVFSNFATKVSLNGWNGVNVINISDLTTYKNFTWQAETIRFTFGCTGHDSSTNTGLYIAFIQGFSGTCWAAPSNLAEWGNLYSIDVGQAAVFPSSITATKFITYGSTSSYLVTGDGSTYALSNLSKASHTHDDRYYTESEIDTKLATKAASSHTHTASQVTGLATVATSGNYSDLTGKPDLTKYLPLTGGTVTGSIISTYHGTGTWIGSLTSSAITIRDHTAFGGWMCGPVKSGHIAISTYPYRDDYFYIGYGETGRTDNSYTTEMKWDAPNNILYAGTFKNSGGTEVSYNGHIHEFSSLSGIPNSLEGHKINDGVNSVSVSGSGNAVTSASISGHKLTLTKGSSFLTSHQSLANYVTLNGNQTITGLKTFSRENCPALYVKRNSSTYSAALIGFEGYGDTSNIWGYIGFTESDKDSQLRRYDSTLTKSYHILDETTTYISGSKVIINNTTADLVPKMSGTGSAVVAATNTYGWSGIKIETPFTYSPNCQSMFAFTVRLYNGYAYTDIVISGYCYGSNFWYKQAAEIIGGTRTYEISFGHNTTSKKLTLWIGNEDDSTLSFGGLSIFNVLQVYGSTYNLYDNWSFSNITQASYSSTDVVESTMVPLIPNNWSNIYNTPTTLSGYGITDGINNVSVVGDSGGAVTSASISGHKLTLTKTVISFSNLTARPSTLSGYGITDAATSTHTHNYIVAEDLRDKYPGQVLATNGMKSTFIGKTLLGLTDSNYYDVITLSTYVNSSGGKGNALIFGKGTPSTSSPTLYHSQFDFQSTTSWGTPIKIIDANNIGSQSVASATKATQDGSGNVITSTYATKTELDDYLPIAGGSMTGHITIPGDKPIWQTQNSTSNWTPAIRWKPAGETETIGRSIGHHNTGNSISIVPYATDVSPWNGGVGLFVSKTALKWEGYSVALSKDIPKTLKNPNALSWSAGSGDTSGSYDGSAAKSISIPTTVAHLSDGVNSVETTGSGNAVTSASISGHKLTLTKGSSFASSTHKHGLLHTDLYKLIDNTSTNSGWSMINDEYQGGILKAIRAQINYPEWMAAAYCSGIAFGGGDTNGVMTVNYSNPLIKFAGGNGTAPVWWMSIKGSANTTYNLSNFSTTDHTHNYSDLSGIPAIDSALSSTSTNAVQNKVLYTALGGKLSSGRMVDQIGSSTEVGLTPYNVFAFKSAGYPLYNDPEFSSSTGGVAVYNNAGNGVITITRGKASSFGLIDSGNSSGYVMKISCTGTASPGYGGFYQSISSRANAIFVQIFRAKIPTGYYLSNASNSMGTSYTDRFITTIVGTGKWEWYARIVHCGSTGTFSSGGHVYLLGATGSAVPTSSSPLVWYLSYCNCIDITKGNYDGLRTKYCDTATSAGNATSSGIGTIKIYPENSTEINFGGTNTETTLYVGYRKRDSRPIPEKFIFGGENGSASIQAEKFITYGSTSSYLVTGDGSTYALSNLSKASHTHDDRYYTESEIDTKLATKAASSHTHTASQVTGLATVATSGNYSDLTGKPAIPTVDSSLSTSSTNAIQNKAVKTALNALSFVYTVNYTGGTALPNSAKNDSTLYTAIENAVESKMIRVKCTAGTTSVYYQVPKISFGMYSGCSAVTLTADGNYWTIYS